MAATEMRDVQAVRLKTPRALLLGGRLAQGAGSAGATT